MAQTQDYFKITYNNSDEFYYIRLGALLQYIQNNVMYGIIQDVPNSKTSMLNFDFEIESNIMFLDEYQISTDPNICVINKTLKIGKSEYNFTPKVEPFESPIFGKGYGQVMNIYIHMKWILLKLEELKDINTNKTILIDFLNNMLSSINSALGGINSLEATIDETTNTIIIRDKNPLPNIEDIKTKLNDYYKNNLITDKNAIYYNNSNKLKIETNYIIFDLYRYNIDKTDPNNPIGHASFIKDFSFKTELSPATSTMLTVGATANSTVVGENSTAFSKFNTGLKDRYKIKIIDSKDSNTDVLSLAEKWINTFGSYIRYIKSLSVEGLDEKNKLIYNPEDANKYKDVLTNILNYKQQYFPIIAEYLQQNPSNPNSQDKSFIDSVIKKLRPYFEEQVKKLEKGEEQSYLGNTGFIPFNLSLTMDGLSGMKIYNKFLVDTEFLPSNYPEYAEFLIKNIAHKIENNKWTTILESFITIKGLYSSGNQDLDPESKSNNQNSSQTSTPGNRNNCTIKQIPVGSKLVSKQVINSYFKSRGYSKAARAAIVANLFYESSLNLNAFNDKEGGCGAYGIAQWRGTRQTNLANYAKLINQPVDSLEAQIGFLYKELETGELRYPLYSFKNATDPSEASFIFSSAFERFENSKDRNNPNVKARQRLAEKNFLELT